MSCQPQVVHFGGSCVGNAGGPGHPPTWIWLLELKVTRPFWQEETQVAREGTLTTHLRCFWTGLGTRKGILPQGLGARAVSLVNQRFPFRPYKLGQQGSLSVCAMCQLGALGLLGTLNEGLLLPPELAPALKVDEMCLFSLLPQGSISEPGLGLLSWWTSS